MKKVGLLKAFAVIAILALALTGCGAKQGGPDKEPKVVFKDALEKLSAAKTSEYEMVVDGEVNAKDAEKTGFEKAVFNATFSGGFDKRDPKAPKFSMKIEGKGSQNGGDEESFDGELRLLSDKLYFSLKNMSDFGGTVPVAFVQPYFGKWWSMVLPEEVKGQVEVYAKDLKDLTPEEQKVRDIFENTEMYKDIKYDGSEKVGSEDTYVYTFEVDRDAVQKMVVEMAKIQGTPLSAEDEKKMNEDWQKMTFTGKGYVSQADMSMRRMEVTLEMKDLEGANLHLEIAFTTSNLDGEVKFEEPADATEFDPMSLLGGMGLPAPSADMPLETVTP